MSDTSFDPAEALAAMRHEFGEHGGVNMSIETSTTFTVLDPELMPAIFAGQRGPDAGGCYLYGRHFNPTVYVLGRELAAIEDTEAGYAVASGMGAVMASILQRCDAGDHVVASNTLYGGTFALLREFLPKKCGIETTFVDVTDLMALEDAITEKTRVLYVESLSNPTLTVADIPRIAAIAHRHGVLFVVDNTFAPIILSPARHGADVVVHSLTKFVSGASDVIAGAVCGSKEFITDLMDLHTGAIMLLGPTLDPRRAFSLSMRLPHLPLRMQEHGRRASFFAEKLEQRGFEVFYPGLPSHPQHELFKSMVNDGYGAGGILAIDLENSERANRFMELLQNKDRFGYMAVSLGYHHTLMSCSAASTSSEMSEEDQRRAGIRPGLVRMSIGYTGSLEQRWNQLCDALAQL